MIRKIHAESDALDIHGKIADMKNSVLQFLPICDIL